MQSAKHCATFITVCRIVKNITGSSLVMYHTMSKIHVSSLFAHWLLFVRKTFCVTIELFCLFNYGFTRDHYTQLYIFQRGNIIGSSTLTLGPLVPLLLFLQLFGNNLPRLRFLEAVNVRVNCICLEKRGWLNKCFCISLHVLRIVRAFIFLDVWSIFYTLHRIFRQIYYWWTTHSCENER